MNPVTGAVVTDTPYYNGITFHRVIKDFMSQTGSRKGDGTDGPGYTFRDEVNNGLTHSGPHVVSMANSGTNTNGAQFFITDVATPHLDGKHTVFGTISGGQAVVDEINNVQTTNDKPVVPVVIHTIAIRRVGAAAIAFDVQAQGLPEVKSPKTTLSVQVGGNVSATILPALPVKSHFRAFRSTTLQAWTTIGGLYVPSDGDPVESISGIESAAPTKAFYHFHSVRYADDPAFSNHASATYILNQAGKRYDYVFNAAGSGGTLTITPIAGATTQSTFTVAEKVNSPYRAQVVIDHGADTSVHGSNAPPRYLRHTFHADEGTSDSFSGRLTSDQYLGAWFSWNSGTFSGSR